jgi:hypothetical protein
MALRYCTYQKSGFKSEICNIISLIFSFTYLCHILVKLDYSSIEQIKQFYLTLWCQVSPFSNVHCDAQNAKWWALLTVSYGLTDAVLLIPVVCSPQRAFNSGTKGLKASVSVSY